LAGPGISTYEEVSKVLPNDYQALLPPLKRIIPAQFDCAVEIGKKG